MSLKTFEKYSEPLQEPLECLSYSKTSWRISGASLKIPVLWIKRMCVHVCVCMYVCVCTYHQLCCYIKPPTCWWLHSCKSHWAPVASGQLPNGTLPRISLLTHLKNTSRVSYLPTHTHHRGVRHVGVALCIEEDDLACYIEYACGICITVFLHGCILATEEEILKTGRFMNKSLVGKTSLVS